jgi:hypothetical protein
MPLNADHFIVLVSDINQATHDYRVLGFTVQERADKVSHGVLYRFIVFEDSSYILLTAFTDPAVQARHRLAPILQEGEGWADYSFMVANVAAVAARLSRLGSPVAVPVSVANTLADGSEWGLKLLMAGRGTGGDDALPFAVEDVIGRHHRIPAWQPHANRATSVETIRIASMRPAATAACLTAITGAALEPLVSLFNGREAVRLGAEAGTAIEIFDDTSAPSLGRRGGGLYELVLRGLTGTTTLDLVASHGARIRGTAK